MQEKKAIKIEDIENFAIDHIKLKNEEELTQILQYSSNIEVFKHGLIEGIINGISSFCDEYYKVEGID